MDIGDIKLTASIIIPSNRPEFIAETIKSIAEQTVKPKEVIILYPTSPMDSAARRMNRGIAMSSGDAFVVLGDDDKLDPQYLEKTLSLMQSSGADVVYTDLEEFGDKTGRHGPGNTWDIPNFKNYLICFFTSLTSKKVWEKVGGYDVNSGPHCDWDFWWRCAEVGGRGERLPEPLFKYRVHGEQDSQTCDMDVKLWSRQYILDKHEKLNNCPANENSQYNPVVQRF